MKIEFKRPTGLCSARKVLLLAAKSRFKATCSWEVGLHNPSHDRRTIESGDVLAQVRCQIPVGTGLPRSQESLGRESFGELPHTSRVAWTAVGATGAWVTNFPRMN